MLDSENANLSDDSTMRSDHRAEGIAKETAVNWGEIKSTCQNLIQCERVINMEASSSSKKKQSKFLPNTTSQNSQKIGKGHVHALQCLNRMEEFRASEILCDVVLESSDGALFKVHKLVLASCSSYFQAMFTNEMRESREEKIKMALESRVLKILIEFAYTCRMDLKSLADVKAVLVAANMLLFSGAETICVDFISKKINARNCVEIITFAEVISSEELSRKAFEFMEKNFVEICSQKGTVKKTLRARFRGGTLDIFW